MPDFKYAPMFQLGPDTTEYYRIPGSEKYVSTGDFEGHTILKVAPEALTLIAKQSFHDCEFMLRRAHNEQVAAILEDPEASENDKYVALARTPEPRSSTAKRARRSGPDSKMRKPSRKASSKPTRRRICATARMRLWICTTR